MIEFGEFPTIYLESQSVVLFIQRVCYPYEENKSGSRVSQLRYRMFTKNNLSGDRLPSTLDALVLQLRRESAQSIDIFSIMFV